MSFIIRACSYDDLHYLETCASTEGWEPGTGDIYHFFDVDPSGFFVGLLNGSFIGCISAVRYSREYGFIGFYVVLPPFRKNGYGIQLFQRALLHLEDRNVGLDAEPDQIQNYCRSGFTAYHNHLRYRGSCTGLKVDNEFIVPLGLVDFETLKRLDAYFHPAPRDSILLWWWRNLENGQAIAFFHQNSLLGYGVIRTCQSGLRIGPLYALQPRVAKDLLSYLLGLYDGTHTVFIDVPEINHLSVDIIENVFGMTCVHSCARMYLKSSPAIEWNQVYGLSFLEVG
jgi:GNAT superfamily N-acetyltransferase